MPQTWFTDSSYQVAILPLSVTTEHLKKKRIIVYMPYVYISKSNMTAILTL